MTLGTTRRRLAGRAGFAGLVVLLLALGATRATPAKAILAQPAAEEPEAEPTEEEAGQLADLPRLEEMPLPEFEDLIKGPAVDWLVLTGRRVLVVEPVVPRPRTLEELEARFKRAAPRAGQRETEAERKQRLALQYLPVTLLEGEEREYQLHVRFIRQVIHFEDLMLSRVDKLLDERKVRQAYELLVALHDREANWPDVAPRRDRLLLTEASVKAQAGELEHALALLESLHERAPAHPGLSELLGEVADRLIKAAVARDDRRQARFFLRRCAKRYPNHKVAADWTGRFAEEARALAGRAAEAAGAGQHAAALDLIEQAARVFPELPELAAQFNRIAGRYQRVRVGVVGPPRGAGGRRGIIEFEADRRHRELTQVALFEPARRDDKVVRYHSRFVEEWDPANLGRTAVLRLSGRPGPSRSQPVLTASGLAAAIAARMDPGSAQFDERLAAAVDQVAVRGPFELALEMRLVPLRADALFSIPLASLAQAGAGAAAAPGHLGYPFALAGCEPASCRYLRAVPEPEALAQTHVSEVVEVIYQTPERAVQGLLRGEVAMLDRLPPKLARGFEAKPEFFVQAYALPSTHLLQFNPASRAAELRSLRRALVYSVDRQRLLQELYLAESVAVGGRLTSAPFATTSYAYDPFVEPHKFDSALARLMVLAAQKELGQKLPPLRLVCADEPLVRAGAARVLEAWKSVGLESELHAVGPAEPALVPGDDTWDVAYRVCRMAEPLVELFGLLTLSDSTATGAVEHLPAWLRRDLLQLDRLTDFASAERALHRLHRSLWADVFLVPLWEIDDQLVSRKSVRNLAEAPLGTYQGVDGWRQEPWFAKEVAP